MMRLARQLFDFDRPETAGDRLASKVLELAVVGWSLAFVWRWAVDIAGIDRIAAPVGLARHVDLSFMLDPGVAVANAAVVTVLLLLGISGRWRWAYLAAVAAMHLQYVARHGLGKIGHGSTLVGMTLLALGLAAVAFERRPDARRAARGLTLFFVGLAYVSAATCKLVATGPGWVDGRHLWLWIGERSIDHLAKTGTTGVGPVAALLLGSRFLATSVLTFGLLAEALAFTVWLRRTRPFALAALVAMHLGIWLTMDILFDANLTLLLALVVPWARIVDRRAGPAPAIGG